MKDQPVTEDLARKVLEVVDCGLSSGLGNPIPGEMCVEAAVCYAYGLPHSDEPPCVHPIVRSFKISLNDKGWSSNAARAKGMRKLAIVQLGSLNIDGKQFVQELATEVIRQILPMTFDIVSKCPGLSKHADKLSSAGQACKENPTKENARKARAAAADAYADADADAAAAADAAADAYADAAAAADAAADAYAYADAAAAAYAAAYAAADAYAYAAADGRTRPQWRDKMLGMLADIAVCILVKMGTDGAKYLFLADKN